MRNIVKFYYDYFSPYSYLADHGRAQGLLDRCVQASPLCADPCSALMGFRRQHAHHDRVQGKGRLCQGRSATLGAERTV